MPGFGASPPPDEAIGAAGYAERIAILLDEFDDPPVVVGHSFGGRVAVCLAAAQPDRLGPLILSGVPLVRLHPSSRPPFSYRLIRSLHRLGLISDDRMERVRQKRGSADYVSAEGVMRDVLVKVVNESYEEELAELRSPVHLLWGDSDVEVPVSVARRAVEIIKEAGQTTADLQLAEGVGHHLPVEAPIELHKVIVSISR